MKNMFLTVDYFLMALKENADSNTRWFIATHRANNTPLNFEISDGQIFFDSYCHTDIGLRIKNKDLYEVMDKIAVFVNNELNCGCTFTMF